MDLLRERVERMGLDASRVTISGRVEMAFVEPRKHYSGSMVDVYRPKVVGLVLRQDGDAVAQLNPGSDEFAGVARTLGDIHRLPLYEMLAETGGPVPHRGVDFSLAYVEMSELARAEEMAFEGLLEEGDEKSVEAGWIKFRHSNAFKAEPCTREEFVAIRTEFLGSQYLTSQNLTDYYAWSRESEKLMDGDAFNAETQATADRMLEAWKNDKDPKSLVYWMTRNLSVHPRHRHVVEGLVQAHLDADGPESDVPAPQP